jgi:hypothetical protein
VQEHPPQPKSQTEVSPNGIYQGRVHHRDRNRSQLFGFCFDRAAMNAKLVVAIQTVAICGVIAVMAWTKAHGFTGVIPYLPHRRRIERLLP